MISVNDMAADEIIKQYQEVFFAWRRGDLLFREAVVQLEAMRARTQELKDRQTEAMVCLALGKAQIERSNLDQADRYLQDAVGLFQSSGFYDLLVEPYLYMGEIAYAQGRMVKAQKHYQDALRLANETKNSPYAAAANSRLSMILIELDQHQQAATALDNALLKALAIPEQNREVLYTIADSFVNLARLYLKMERWQEADYICQKAIEAAQQTGSLLMQGVILRIQGQIVARSGSSQDKDPLNFFDQSLRMLRQIKADAESGHTLIAVADYLMAQNKAQEAAETYHRAMQVFLRSGLAAQAGLASEMERFARFEGGF